MGKPVIGFMAALLLAMSVAGQAAAQWSIGAPGTREAPRGEKRFAYFVFADPLPGMQEQFDDWYLNTHMGDLVQLDGWIGAQRFRLETSVTPRRTAAGGFRHGNVILWDQQGADIAPIRARIGDAINGGKSRRGAAFDYTPGAGLSTTYEAATPRMTRPDGVKAWMPPATENKIPRPNRYVIIEMIDPPAGVAQADFEKALDARSKQMLAIPGVMAVQRFRWTTLPAAANGVAPPRLTPTLMQFWELEGTGAVELRDRIDAAVKAGAVATVATNTATDNISWWRPISPYITKEDFER